MAQGDNLISKLEQLRGQYSTLRENIEQNRKFYDLDFEEKVVPGTWSEKFSVLIPPTARWAIDEAVDHILFTPRIKTRVRPSADDKKIAEQDIAENKRRWIATWWDISNRKNNILADARKTLINEGMVAVRQTVNWNVIPQKPSARAKAARQRYRDAIARLGMDQFPWEQQILDNVTVFVDPSNHRDPRYIFVEYTVFTEDALAMFPEAGDPGPDDDKPAATTSEKAWRVGGDYAEVTYREFWSRDSYGPDGTLKERGKAVQWINNDRVHDMDNPYPYIPIAVEDAGFGQVRQNAKPEDIFVGMTQFVQPTFVAEARQMTAWETVAELIAYGMYTARNRDPNKSYDLGPGAIIDLEGDEGTPGAESLNPVQLPEVPLSVIQLVNKTTSIANDTLKMRTLGGQPLAGVETASEADQQIRNATAKLAGPVSALERLAAKLTSWALMDVEDVIEAPVTLYAVTGDSNAPGALTLKPTDIGGYFDVHAELRTTDEEAVNMVKARFWAEMYRLIPFMSAWTAMERGEISDQPKMEMIRRASEDAYMSPEFAMVRKMTAASSFGEFVDLAKSTIAGNASQNGATPPGGASPAGGSQPTDLLTGGSVPAAQPGSAGAARDILQGPDLIRG